MTTGSARKIGNYLLVSLLSIVIALMTAWAVLAIYYSNLPGEYLRISLSGLFGLATISAFVFLPKRGRTLVWFLAVFAGIIVWWIQIPASNDRNWQRDVTATPYATIQGDEVTVHNIRNLNYRTETDFDVRYYDKTFDLKKLDSVDLLAVYWMGDAIAHIMISFGFQGNDYIAFSIETRKEQGEDYSTIKGFFKQYELIYIVGDERDLIRVRTDYRNPREDVYLFRFKTDPERARKFFLEYVRQINFMKNKPEWYNTLTTNCTTNIIQHMRAFGGRARYNWKILLSGYAPQYAYEMGGIDRSMPFEELKKLGHINKKVQMIGNDPQFSRKIRE
jgi:hypothetical protein